MRFNPTVEGFKVDQHLGAYLHPNAGLSGAVSLDGFAAAVLAVMRLEFQVAQRGGAERTQLCASANGHVATYDGC